MKILYVTYDGLLDPLGGSQILPYIKGINSSSKSFKILSFEKSKSAKKISLKRQELSNERIEWIPLNFTKNTGLLSKFRDLLSLYLNLISIFLKNDIDVVHARGLPCASAVLTFKKIFRFKLIFDFRGLWADERVTKGGWDLSKYSHYAQYKYYKLREKALFQKADQIIVLTNAVRKDLAKNINFSDEIVNVIPCAADFKHFRILDENSSKLPSSNFDLVLGYLGSIGPMYRFDKYLELIEAFKKESIQIKGLVISKDINYAKRFLYENNFSHLQDCLQFVSAEREEIPALLNQMSYLVSFYTLSYSVISVSPTKIGESLACGIPIICNSGIGDTDFILNELNGGHVMKDFSTDSIKILQKEVNLQNPINKKLLRNRSRKYFDLEHAIQKYNQIYDSLT